MRGQFALPRRTLTGACLVLIVAVLVPPVLTAATQYAFAQAVQFAVLAVAAPALFVLGAPWPDRMAVTVARIRSRWRDPVRSWTALAIFVVAVVGWRLPAVADAVPKHGALVALEVVTLLPAGIAVWLELVGAPELPPTLSQPLRAVFAAVAMWSIWVIAYITGFAEGSLLTAFHHPIGSALGAVGDQEIAAALLWAVSGLCFVPVVFVSWISWLRDSSEPDAELREMASQTGPYRPPRGWRLPSG